MKGYNLTNPNLPINISNPCTGTGSFYPFGTGDKVNKRADDGSSPVIDLLQPFIFFGLAYKHIFVNNNGHLTFNESWSNFFPYSFPGYGGRDIIAPFWTDFDNRFRGVISYRQYTSGSVLTQATQDINQYFPDLSFSASCVFVATWDRVPYAFYPGTKTSFQVVLISNGNFSFILMNYGALAPSQRFVQAGYDTINSGYYFSITQSLQNFTSLANSSNVNVSGRWAFRTDLGARCSQFNDTGPFYPFGTRDTVNDRSDDGSSEMIYLLQPFIFFGFAYNQIYVNNNGHLTFDAAWRSYSPYSFPGYGGKDIIAPFWTDIDNRLSGVISYQQYTSGSVLTQATQDINQYFPDLSFSASWVFVATWDKVAYVRFPGTKTSFQVALISNGNFSFVLMNYGKIVQSRRFIQAGYDTINSGYYFSITESLQNFTILTNSSNVNVSGRWAFRTDHGLPGCQFNGFPIQLRSSFWSDSTCKEKCTCTHSGLRCTLEPCTYSQACRKAAFQYSCQNIQRKTCNIYGDPHYTTFDNQIFHFQGTCTHVLSEACKNGLLYYRIEGKNEHHSGTHVSWTRVVRLLVYDEEIELIKGHYYEAKVNGTFISTPFTLNNGSIHVYQSGLFLVISTDFGLVVTYDSNSWVNISVPYEYQNATCGLCGNFNLHAEDDFCSPSGEILSSDVDFVNSWIVEGYEDPECHNVSCTGLACAVCSSNETSVYNDKKHCGILADVSGPFAACHSVLAPQTYIENCVYDLCAGRGYQPILCQVLNVYAAQCQQQGIQLDQWRKHGFCEIYCPNHSSFESQGTSCYATCSNPYAPIKCPLPNQESCICDDGYILSAGKCVPETDCGCTFEGFYYAKEQSVVLDDDCGRKCVCRNRTMICNQHQCGPAEVCGVHNGVRGCRPTSYANCSVEGLGSYHTFDGHTFQYPGACGLTLARVMGQSQWPHFALTVEKVPRDNQDFARLLKFEAEGTHVSIEIGEGSNVQVDGQIVSLPISIGSSQIYIYHSSVMGLVLETNFWVTIRADWPHLVRITVPSTYNGTLGGLCGNLNGNINDEFYSPDRVLVNDSQAFAESWHDVSLSAHCEDRIDLFESLPRHYQNSRKFSEPCSIMSMLDGPFANCSRTLDPTQRVQYCIQMLEQASGDRAVLCEAIEGYTLLCQQNGIEVGEWRNISHCEPTCPPNTHYELCGTSCPASCSSLSFPIECSILQCQEGCQCNDGLVLNGNDCVPPTNCGCRHNGRYRQPEEVFWDGKGCQSFCVCNGFTGNVHCISSSCNDQEVCRVVEGEYGCHPNPHAKCSVEGDPHYISFDGAQFDFQGTCRYVLATVCNDTHGFPAFKVDARNEAWDEFPVSNPTEVFVNVSGHLVHMSQDKKGYFSVQFDGEIRNLPIYESDRISVYSTGWSIHVSTDFGLSVTFDGRWMLNIIVPADYRGVMCGLCGNYNGQTEDDFMTPSGSLALSEDQFGASWKVEDEVPCTDHCGDNCPLCQNQTTANALCEIIRDNKGPFRLCHPYIDPQVYFDDCLFDVCLSGNLNDVLCRAVQSYVSACQSANAAVFKWREDVACVMTCPENAHYELCGTNCGHTCASSIDASCEYTCTEGCFCNDGFLRSGRRCVPVEQCGCMYDGFYYNIGEKFWISDCLEQCKCFGPYDLRCSKDSCPPAMNCTFRNGRRGCYDIYECLDSLSVCGPNAYCHNYNGSNLCSCWEGYDIIDVSQSINERNPCIDVDECVETPEICGPNSICNNTAGSYNCLCLSGYNVTDPNLPITISNPCGVNPPSTTTSSATVIQMSMRVNQFFDTSLINETETKYKFYVEHIKSAIEESYMVLPNYIKGSVKVTRFRFGSIIADYTITTNSTNLDVTSANTKVSDTLLKAGIPLTQDAFAESEEKILTLKDKLYPLQDVELRCTRPNSVAGTMKWNVNGKDLAENSAKYTITNDNSTLIVNNASESDTGRYSCIIERSTLPYIQWQRVVIGPRPNIIVDKIEIKFQCQDQIVPLTCCADGYSVEWDRIPAGDNVTHSGNGCVTLKHKVFSTNCGSKEDFTCRLKGMTDLHAFDYSRRTVQVQTVREFDCINDTLGVGKVGDNVMGLCEKGLEGYITYKCQQMNLKYDWIPIQRDCVVKAIKDLDRKTKVLFVDEIPVFMLNLSNAAKDNNIRITQSAATVQTIVEILHKIASMSQTIAISQTVMEDFLKTVNVIISDESKNTWEVLNNDIITRNKSTKLLQAIETISDRLSDGDFMLKQTFIQLNRTTIENSFIGSSLLPNSTTQIVIPNVEPTLITIIIFTKLDNVLTTRNTSNNDNKTSENHINGDVVVIKTSKKIDKVSFTFDITNTTLKNPQCVFWNFDLDHWDSTGCKVKLLMYDMVTCECNHTTSFSILMSPFESNHILDYITYIGVAISMASLILCLIIEIIVWKSVTGNETSYMRHVSIVNVAVSLLIADIWFIIGAATANPGQPTPVNPCSAAVFFIHFFYLALFFWMLLSALLLLNRTAMASSQMPRAKMMVIAFTVGYCAPLLIAVITVASTAGAGRYIWMRDACWLNWSESKALLAFVIPALTIVVFNLLVYIVVVCKILRRGLSAQPDEINALIVIARCVAILTPFFGITWGFGTGTMLSPEFGIHVIFATLNSLQGFFVLVFGTLLDRKVRESAKRLIKNLSSSHARNTNPVTTPESQAVILHTMNVDSRRSSMSSSVSAASSSSSGSSTASHTALKD
nr:alpha-tectorin-like [Misgurnus anguillicaudatus]